MDILEKVKKQGLLLDGAMGSMLISKGLSGGEVADKWNIDHPEIIQEIHTAYFNAGAEVASSATFGASSYKLEKMGVKESADVINSAAIQNAKAVAQPGQYIAGNIGPTGEMLSPMGTMTYDRAKKIYGCQAEAMEAAGVDLFIVQTFFDVTEAQAAIEGIQEVSSKPVFCTLTFNHSERGYFTLMGNPVVESMQQLRDAGAAAVGANCSMGSDTMVDLARQIRGSVEIPVICQPNAGMPQLGDGGVVYYSEDETFFTENILKIKALGIEIVGGCCGTTPEFIKKIKESIAGGYKK